MATEPVNIWDRQPRESAQAYEAARTYFMLGADRSLEAVAQRLHKSKTIAGRWSARHSWVGRAAAYDAHMQLIDDQEHERARRKEIEKWERRRLEQRENDWQLAERLRERANEMADRPIEVVQKVMRETRVDGHIIYQEVDEHHPAGWDWRSVPKIAETAAKLARLAAEMETDRAALTVQDQRPDLSKLSDEELEVYERLTAKAADAI
jgi:hypothetical protein